MKKEYYEIISSYLSISVKNAPAIDEENFRLISGFNDIFIVISCLLEQKVKKCLDGCKMVSFNQKNHQPET
ncbi:MAG: hypothetical protein GY714_27240 [Desulfobacterales bacterium]|nr:hypothetical protein [Desulfobacterales bacterium]MCP4160753.1 hypothetical protein [Deltaproteobacteria bacterium]